MEFQKKSFELFDLLQDDLSKNIFWMLLQHDAWPSIDTVFGLIGLMDYWGADRPHYCSKAFDIIAEKNKKLIQYGTGDQGRTIARNIAAGERDFLGFCTRNSERYPKGLLNKPVLSPQELFKHSDDFYVIISTNNYYEEIYRCLCENHFPDKRILLHGKSAQSIQGITERQYFEFRCFFKKGTAFIDGGCFDAKDSIKFSRWCCGGYSKIIAFEPDSANIPKCEENQKKYGLRDFELVSAGVSNEAEEIPFISIEGELSGSHFLTDMRNGIESDVCVPLTTIDNVVGNTEVGFIKMDIEGFELRALQGAAKTIARDKPLLAICVYHKKGDLLSIMEYLHRTIPEYKFWVRHYSISQNETVLYAAVPDSLKGVKNEK